MKIDVDRILKHTTVKPGAKFRLREHEPDWTDRGQLKDLTSDQIKGGAKEFLDDNVKDLTRVQELLWASDTWSVLVILQAMDAAGKDSTIKHVMSGVNPQGCSVQNFKQPSAKELDHTFLWRAMRVLPERGKIVIFNRSYYEDVLVARVHPEILESGKLPPGKRGKAFWKGRYDDINNLERHLSRNGTLVLKFFLNVSRQEQKKRFLDRLDEPDKHWKFSASDVRERRCWDEYMHAYEEMLRHTSTGWAPWHVVPADNKWVMRAIVAAILAKRIDGLDLSYPKVTAEQKLALAEAREQLESE